MPLKVAIAKIIMRLLPSRPIFDTTHPRSETINHKDFINANEQDKNRILLQMAASHYMGEKRKPFDLFFPGYSLRNLLKGKRVLDLGCWCGGETVAFAERWDVQSIDGIDINEYFIRAAILFSSSRPNKNIEFRFNVGFGETLPYEDATFDAIVSHDVFEHVRSPIRTIRECKRVLKTGGILFCVFPSYYFPFGGAHFNFVTRMPCIQWLFDPVTLNTAYDEIIKSRGEEAYWYKPKEIARNKWEKLHGGIGINGVTFSDYKSMAREAGFSEVHIFPTPLLSVSDLSIQHPIVKDISKILKPLLRIESLQDYLSHRIVSMLVA